MAGKPEQLPRPGSTSAAPVLVYVSNDNSFSCYQQQQQQQQAASDVVVGSVDGGGVSTGYVAAANAHHIKTKAAASGGSATFYAAAPTNGFPMRSAGDAVGGGGYPASQAIRSNQAPQFLAAPGTSFALLKPHASVAVANSSGHTTTNHHHHHHHHRSNSSSSEDVVNNLAVASSFVTAVMASGGSGGTTCSDVSLVPRCDSVRSETAESSCSSLSNSSCNEHLAAAAGAVQPDVLLPANSVAAARNANNVASVASDSSPNAAVQLARAAGGHALQLVQPLQAASAAYKPVQLQSSADGVHSAASVSCPPGWKRLLSNGVIIFVSPSNTALRSLEQVKTYLQTQGTCKCGLQCPLNCDTVFNFDPKVATRPWSGLAPPNHLTGLCNHKRKAMALAHTHTSASGSLNHYQDIKKLEAAVRRKKRRIGVGVRQIQQYGGGSAGSGGAPQSVSQILAQRETDHNSKDTDQQETWNDGARLRTIPEGSSPVIIQNHMIVNPATGRVQYPPGYHDSSNPGNMPIGQSSSAQYFRYNPANQSSQSNTSPGIVDSDMQMMCNNQNSNQHEFSAANNAYNHSTNMVMASNMDNSNEENSNSIQNSSQQMLQVNSCPAPGQNMMIAGHQQHIQNFVPHNSQQRIHVACNDINSNNALQHENCVQGPKTHTQQQIFMSNQNNTNIINQQLLQTQQQQQHHHHPHQLQQQQHSQNQTLQHHHSMQQHQQNENQQLIMQQQQQQQQQQHHHHHQQLQIHQQQQIQHQQQFQSQQHPHSNQQQFQHHMQQQSQYQNTHISASVPIQHNALPTHILNTSSSSSSMSSSSSSTSSSSSSSSSPRPTNPHVTCQPIQSIPTHQHADSNHTNLQFHPQQQQQQLHQHRPQPGPSAQEQLKSVQHVHVVNGNKVSCNQQQQGAKTNVSVNGGAQVLLTSGLNNRGIVCDNNYSGMQAANRHDIPQHHQQSSAPTAMIIQTSQGQVMIPTAQAMASGMLVQSQPNNHNSQNSHVHGMSIGQNSAVLVQGAHGSPVLHNAGHINQQGQPTMVLHQNQNSQSLVSQQGLQVQTAVGGQHHMTAQQGVHQHQQQMAANHHIIPSSSNNVIPAGSGITQQQRSIPPWQQNKQMQQQNQQLNQNIVINSQPQQQQQPQHIIQQHPSNVYERVPPLHHQQTQQIPAWQQHPVEDNIKKKFSKVQNKTNLVKRQRSPYNNDSNHHNNMASGNNEPCPNIDVRHLHNDQKNNNQQMIFSSSNVPSFMEDPSGYLAQQTALLNSTISRQTGVHNSNMICHSPCQNQNSPDQNSSGQLLVNVPNSACSPISNQGVPVLSNVMQMSSKQPTANQQQPVRSNQLMNTVRVYRSNSVSSTGSISYQNQSQPGTPDSSDIAGDKIRLQQSSTSSSSSSINSNVTDSNNLQGTVHIIHHNSNSGKQIAMDDSPVTSSTFIENRGQGHSNSMSDSRGPIQGGTVSTSNRSPAEVVHKIQPPDITSPVECSTPTSSTQICRSSPESPSTQNILVSVSSPYVNHSASPIILTSHPCQSVMVNRPNEPRHHHQQQQQQQLSINIQVQDVAGNRIPAIVTTMASGHTVSSNTITSVLAGRANTATVSVNNPTTQTPQSATPPVLTNQSPQVSQNQVTKSPLEMVQSVVSSIQVPNVSTGHTETAVLKPANTPNLPPGHILVSSNGQLLVANTNGGPPTILSPQQNIAKIGGNSPMPPMSGSSIVTTVTGAVTQVIPAVGVTQQVLGQPTVLVNALPAPLLFQPGVMTVDGSMNAMQIPHLAVATSNTMLQSGQMVDESRVQQNNGGAFSPRTQQALLSPDSANSKRKANLKKRKVSPQTVANMLHIAAQQTSPTAGAAGMVVQQPQPQQGYNSSAPMLQALTILPSKSGHFGGTQQLIATTNVLQPLNLVQNFPTIQQFIVPAGLGGMVMATGDGTATLLPEAVQLNVLTPVQGPAGTVFSHAGGQSILATGPAGMVIRTPTNNNQNTTKVQHVTSGGGQQFIAANSPNQFLMQSSPAATFGGQLSPLLTNVSPTSQPIHSFSSPGAAGTVSRNRNGQAQEFIQCSQTLMVPCTIAQAPPAQNTTVVQQNTTIVQQQTTMVSNNQQSMDQNQGGPATSSSASSSSSSSSLSLNQHNFILNNGDGKQAQNFIITTDKQNQGNFILSPNPDNKGTHIILNNINSGADKQQHGFLISQSTDKATGQICDNYILTNSSSLHATEKTAGNFIISGGTAQAANAAAAAANLIQQEKLSKFAKHSVSTQTAAAAANAAQQQNAAVPIPVALIVATTNTFSQTSSSASASGMASGGSPPDTTTHSPVDASSSPSPGLQTEVPSSSSVAVGDDHNLSASPTSSSDRVAVTGGLRSQPMVQCVSSSNEQDSPPADWTSGGGKEAAASSSPGPTAIFSPPPHPPHPPSTNIDVNNYGRGGSVDCMKTVSVTSYVESSTVQQYDDERLHKHSVDESLSHQVYQYHHHNNHHHHHHSIGRGPKRKHSQMCSDSEARIHTSTLSPDDDEDDSGGSLTGASSEGEEVEEEEEEEEEEEVVVRRRGGAIETGGGRRRGCEEAETRGKRKVELEVGGRKRGSSDEVESGGRKRGGGGPGAGDLVWGAARGFPSWPGKLVGPAPTQGRVWVRWFGGGHGPLSEVEPHRLKTLSEGLEAHHRARKKFRKSRKLNSQLENAIQEAMAELDRMSETPQQGPPQPPPPTQLCHHNHTTGGDVITANNPTRLRRTHR